MRPAISLLLLSFCLPLGAHEMLVFKKEGPYKGAAMKISGYEKQAGRLLIKTDTGDVFSAAEDTVDWERSRQATVKLREQEKVQAAKQAAEDEARRVAEARPKEELTLVQASRRYGVDKPAFSVASGSAFKNAPPPAPADAGAAAAPAGGASAPAEGGGSGLPREVRQAQDRLDSAKAERAAAQKELDAVRKDTNPDPVSAAQRGARVADKEKQVNDLDRRVNLAQAELDRMRTDQSKPKN